MNLMLQQEQVRLGIEIQEDIERYLATFSVRDIDVIIKKIDLLKSRAKSVEREVVENYNYIEDLEQDLELFD